MNVNNKLYNFYGVKIPLFNNKSEYFFHKKILNLLKTDLIVKVKFLTNFVSFFREIESVLKINNSNYYK